MSSSPPINTGAQLIAHALSSLRVQVIFGIVGIPVIEVAEACLAEPAGCPALGVRRGHQPAVEIAMQACLARVREFRRGEQH